MTTKSTPGLSTTDKAILQHLQRHGLTSAQAVASALCVGLDLRKQTITKAMMELAQRGLCVADESRTKDHLYSVTPRGRYWLKHGHAPITGSKATSGTYNLLRADVYQPKTDATTYRPGSQDAFALPSRVGNFLLYPRGVEPPADEYAAAE